MLMEWISNVKVNGILALSLYWSPLVFCLIFYTVRTAKNYMKDKVERAKAERLFEINKEHDKYRGISEIPGYYPTDSVGTLIGRAIVSICPVANLWAALFDLAPEVFKKLFEWIGEVFNQPLVPPKKIVRGDK